ncbi:MAG TPA: pilus assembly protein TadG-related protein [Nitrolancea sp.]|nr:pilus assembly protein TadG-related protein [Nitrolancea sp.]
MRAATRTHTGMETGDISSVPSTGAREPRRMAGHASRGQIIIMFAAALIGLIGLLGLATDLGYAFIQRRTMQNAADAGAIAGAHTILKSNPASPSIILDDVKDTASENKTGDAKPTVTHCQYVDDGDNELGSCSDPVPTGATGVSVTVKETHNTFFIKLIPGGPKTVSTKATAIAHVQVLQGLPGDGPFLVCGVNTDVISGHSNPLSVAIKDAGGHWILNPEANGVVFQIHGPQINHCGLQSSDFKGAALQSTNKLLQTPDWFSFSNGDNAGPIAESVLGIQGCKANGLPVNNCVAFLPVAVPDPNQSAHPGKLWTVLIAPFYIQQIGSSGNKHSGTLIGDYVVEGSGIPGWTPDNPLPTVIRLTK